MHQKMYFCLGTDWAFAPKRRKTDSVQSVKDLWFICQERLKQRAKYNHKSNWTQKVIFFGVNIGPDISFNEITWNNLQLDQKKFILNLYLTNR